MFGKFIFISYPHYYNTNDAYRKAVLTFLAEREGFEPSNPLRGYRFSRPAHSTTMRPLRVGLIRPIKSYLLYQKAPAMSGAFLNKIFTKT